MMHLMMLMLLPLMVVSSINGPELFGTNQKTDKLVVKNHIGYHFKKVVKEVSQELFVSRKIDVSSLFLGIKILEQTHQNLELYCVRMTFRGGPESGKSDGKLNKRNSNYAPEAPTFEQRYVHVEHPEKTGYREGKARCSALGMQLPEVYTLAQFKELKEFLTKRKISKCHAGLEPDIGDAIFRFVATGLPIWKATHNEVNHFSGLPEPVARKIDNIHTKWFYGDDGRLYFRDSTPSIVLTSRLGDPTYRDNQTTFSQLVAPLVCEKKWNGLGMNYFRDDPKLDMGMNVVTVDVSEIRGRRSTVYSTRSDLPPDEMEEEPTLRSISNDNRQPRSSEVDALREYCSSVAAQAQDAKADMLSKLQDLLSLADISFQLENNGKRKRRAIFVRGRRRKRSYLGETRRTKRFFLAKMAFKMGFKLIWGLFGFAQKVSDYRTRKKMKHDIAANAKQSNENLEAIREMSKTVLDHSISIERLRISTAHLERRMANLETKVGRIESIVSNVTRKIDTTVEIALISNLIFRIQSSMDSGYDVLKDIIHSSLLGQTSPLLLPLDQMVKVQNAVQKVSSGVLDGDFIKMQSIIVSDPTDPSLLLVVINVAATSRKPMELVKLVPIPSYENGKTFTPILDYNSIILDPYGLTYSILTPQEEQDCLTSRCYVQDTERSVSQRSCGIPQYYDQSLDTCMYEETLSNGVFMRNMLPDGVLFAFRTEVSSQMFCNDNKDVGEVRKMAGMGTMQLPNGCTLSVTNQAGQNAKIKGPAMYRMIDADDLTLVLNGPLGTIRTDKGDGVINKVSTYEGLLASQLSPVINQVTEANVKIAYTHVFIWILVGVAAFTIVIVIIVAAFYCRHYYKIFAKIYALRTKLGDLVQQVLNLTNAREHIQTARARINALNPLPRIPRSLFSRGIMNHLPSNRSAIRNEPGSPVPSAYVSMQELNSGIRNDRTYVSFKTIPESESNLQNDYSRHTLPRRYPRLSPMLAEMQEKGHIREEDELEMESLEVEELLSRRSVSPDSKSKP